MTHSYPSYVLLTERFAATGCTFLFPLFIWYPGGCHLFCSATTQSPPSPSAALSWGSRQDPPAPPSPHTAQVTTSQHSNTAHSHPLSNTCRVSSCRCPTVRLERSPSLHNTLPSRCSLGLARTGKQRSNPGLPRPFTDTALRRPSLTHRVSLAHSLSLLHATEIHLSPPHWTAPP